MNIAVFAAILCAVFAAGGCRSRSIALGNACTSPYEARSEPDCAPGLECILVAENTKKPYVCTVRCKEDLDCKRLGASYRCSQSMTHDGTGGCYR